ncbi:MAG: ABC transporter permease, partial [Gammaproteobacteria bacterium]
LMGRMATRGVIVSLSRTGVAVAALTVVISVSLGMAIMIDSFRHTFSAWLNQTLQADFYVSAAGPSGTPLAPAAVNAIKSQPEVAAVSTGKRWYLDGPRAITEVFVLDPAPASKKGFRFKYGEPETAWQAFLHRNALLISESYATRHALKVGDTLVLRTERGEQRFPVAGVYYDYGSDQGVVASAAWACISSRGLTPTPRRRNCVWPRAARKCCRSGPTAPCTMRPWPCSIEPSP